MVRGSLRLPRTTTCVVGPIPGLSAPWRTSRARSAGYRLNAKRHKGAASAYAGEPGGWFRAGISCKRTFLRKGRLPMRQNVGGPDPAMTRLSRISRYVAWLSVRYSVSTWRAGRMGEIRPTATDCPFHAEENCGEHYCSLGICKGYTKKLPLLNLMRRDCS